MKKILALHFIIAFSCISFSQRGFYRNLYGNWGEHLNTPNFQRVNKLSNGQFFVTSSVNYYTDYFTCSKLDSDFNVIWETSYLYGTESPTNLMEYGREMTDGYISSIGIYGTSVYMVHSPEGSLVSCNRYAGPDGGYHIGTVLESSLPDSSSVFVVGQCSMLYGLIKVNKYGDVIWAYEYYNGHTKAKIYNLEHAADYGYLTSGNRSETIDGILTNAAVLTLSNDDGTFRKAAIYKNDLPDRNTLTGMNIEASKSENAYYFGCFTMKNDEVPVIYDKNTILCKTDSNLAITKQWSLYVDGENNRLRIANMESTSDGYLIVNGYIRDVIEYDNQTFIAKIDPRDEGSIVWAKTVDGIHSPHLSQSPRDGLELFGPYEDILFSFSCIGDGATLASMDQNGEGFCNSTAIDITMEPVSFIHSEPYVLEPTIPEIFPYEVPMTPHNIAHTDTVLCYTSDLSVPTEQINSTIINWQKTGTNEVVFRNTTTRATTVHFYTIQGQLISTIELGAFESKTFVKPKGILIYKAVQGNSFDSGKIL